MPPQLRGPTLPFASELGLRVVCRYLDRPLLGADRRLALARAQAQAQGRRVAAPATSVPSCLWWEEATTQSITTSKISPRCEPRTTVVVLRLAPRLFRLTHTTWCLHAAELQKPAAPRDIIYGCTELLSPDGFQAQLAALARTGAR